MEDRCVMCGEIIPEGRMVCPICERKINNENAENSTESKRHSQKKEDFVYE